MKKLLMCNCVGKFGNVAPLVLRLSVGAIFAMHGWQKLTVMGVSGVEGMLNALGFPMAGLLAVVLLTAEIAGGIALILGVMTHWAAKVLAVVAIVALFAVHIKNGFFAATGGYEFMLLILAATISILITGPGKYSLDHKWLKRG